jgi:CheY-like chemotaxis protein
MNSIVGFSELALDGKIPLKTRDYLDKILENSDWLLQLINNILDISKVESGKMELERVPFDLHELLAVCRTSIMPKVMEKGLSLDLNAEPSNGRKLLGDPTRLRQVLLNLLTNAVKFTYSGCIELSASVTEKEDNCILVRFEVRDSGIGMTQEQLAKIFDPFEQAESGTTRKYGGTGLGLPIARNIVELMGGTIVAESAPKAGSVFSFELIFDTVDTDSELAGQDIVFSEYDKPFFSGEILLCEDNEMNQEVICEHFERVGLRTVVAGNGQEGIEVVRGRLERGEKPFDLIFMDINMPVMGGLEAAPRIAALGTGTPIIALSANIMPQDRVAYQNSGMPDFMSKPFTSQELWRCLLKYLTPVSWSKVDRAGGTADDEELQQKLKMNFLKNNRDRFGEISRAIDAGDIKLAHRLAHTLRSNAGQLGKTGLQKAAGKVERLLEDGMNLTTPDHLEALGAELSEVLAELSHLADVLAAQREAEARTLDEQEARDVFDRLAPLLDDGDAECLKLVSKLYLIPGTDELIGLLEDLEFEAAAEALEGLRQQMPRH